MRAGSPRVCRLDEDEEELSREHTLGQTQNLFADTGDRGPGSKDKQAPDCIPVL